ncbi:MAG: CBS domain-containing protein [Acidimicrobiia bacterium]
MPEVTVRDIMTTEVVTIGPDASVPDAADRFAEHGYHALPVVDAENALVGMLTDEDLIATEARVHVPTFVNLGFLGDIPVPSSMRRLEDELRHVSASTVKELMDTDVATVGPDDSIEAVATVMHDRDVSHVPVVDQGQLVGIVARHDLIRHLAATT